MEVLASIQPVSLPKNVNRNMGLISSSKKHISKVPNVCSYADCREYQLSGHNHNISEPETNNRRCICPSHRALRENAKKTGHTCT